MLFVETVFIVPVYFNEEIVVTKAAGLRSQHEGNGDVAGN